MKKIISSFVILSLLFAIGGEVVVADELEYSDEISSASKFIEDISMEEEFSLWENASVSFAYELFEEDLSTISDVLFYVINNNEYVGYVIVGSEDDYVVEFSLGIAPYDNIQQTINTTYIFIYHNCIPMCYCNGMYYYVEEDGTLSFYRSENTIQTYYPNLQGSYNCIVGAISNIMWHHGMNGYSSLISGMTFSQVESQVNGIIVGYGGYNNSNIPNTISDYVWINSSYAVAVFNQSNPTFTNVFNEVMNRPCLLGFAAGSPYSSTEGHMTVCVGTSTIGGQNFVKLIDGHSTSIVYRTWGSYNDFMSKVVMA